MTADRSPHRRWARRLAPVAACALAAATLAACGSGDDDDDGGATTAGGAATGAETTPQGSASSRLALVAEESGGLRFDRSRLDAQAGDVTIALDNPGRNQLPHAVEIEGEGVEEESGTIEPGAAPTEVTANLRPGTYTFYCPVGDHRQQGMEGTLTVR
jgi:plastocyanin